MAGMPRSRLYRIAINVQEVSMDKCGTGRRDFLTKIAAAGLPVLTSALRSRPVFAADPPVGPGTRVAYDPAAKFDITVSEVEFRRTAAGRMLMARIYQPR